MHAIFSKALEKNTEIMSKALDAIPPEQYRKTHVVLAGGFGASPALYEVTKKLLNGIDPSIRLHRPYGDDSRGIGPANASVAKGAVDRAADKNFGAKRILTQNVGISRWIPYERASRRRPGYSAEVINQEGWKDDKCYMIGRDGVKYLDCIEWKMRKVCDWTIPSLRKSDN